MLAAISSCLVLGVFLLLAVGWSSMGGGGCIHGNLLLGFWGGGLCGAPIVLHVVTIEKGVMWVVVGSSNSWLRSSTGTFPRTSAGGAKDGDIAAKVRAGEVYGVLAEDEIAHPHIGESLACDGVWCDWWSGPHLGSAFASTRPR